MSNQLYTFLPLKQKNKKKSSFFSFYDLFDISQLFVFLNSFFIYFLFWSVLFELDKGKEEFLSLVF
jgi:hypothetical protein